MRKGSKIFWGIFLLCILFSYLGATEIPAIQETDTAVISTNVNSSQVQANIEFDDVITASDAGAGDLTSKDILLIVTIIFAVIGLIVIIALI
ncbi:MAG: hypothetical protein ACE5WD_08400 [Candidatus Aminicenantia bacterium]